MFKWKVLFVCRANQVRSQFAEAILTKLDPYRFCAYSAGFQIEENLYPSTQGIHPKAYNLLKSRGYSVNELFVKHFDEFLNKIDNMDFIITLCDKDLETPKVDYPAFLGQPVKAIWGVHDPVLLGGDEDKKDRTFLDVFNIIRRRIELFVSLPEKGLKELSIKPELNKLDKPVKIEKKIMPDDKPHKKKKNKKNKKNKNN